MSFLSDLSSGREAEEKFVALLQAHGINAQQNTATTLTEKRFYDVFTSKGVLYEIKRDKMWKRTGNIYIEDGSLITSKADLYIYLLGDDFYELEKTAVETLVKKKSNKKVRGGDQQAPGTLVPVENFLKAFRKI